MAIAIVDLSIVLPGVKVMKFHNRTEWTLNGQLHRAEGPAIEFVNGDKRWIQNGEVHRVEGPAVEYANGTKCWYQNGELYHVEDTEPCGREQPVIKFANGTKD